MKRFSTSFEKEESRCSRSADVSPVDLSIRSKSVDPSASVHQCSSSAGAKPEDDAIEDIIAGSRSLFNPLFGLGLSDQLGQSSSAAAYSGLLPALINAQRILVATAAAQGRFIVC